MSDGSALSTAPIIPSMTREEMGQACLKWQRLLRKLAFKYTRDIDSIDDIVNETVISALRFHDKYDPTKAAVSTWLAWRLRAVVSRRRTDAQTMKRGGGKAAISLSSVTNDGEEIEIAIPVEPTQNASLDLRDALRVASTLSDREQTVLLRRADGDSLEDIAMTFGVSKQRIQQIETSARDTLLKRMRAPVAASRRFTDKPALNPTSVRDLPPTHPAVTGKRTLFPSTVVDITPDAPDRLLVSGRNNRKLGDVVAKGRFAGYALYGFSLEERATCPSDCAVKDICYGNGMQMARRHRIVDPEIFYGRMSAEVADLISQHGGLLVRLHVLGDFPSVDYVAFWIDLLEEHPKLAVYGYTARKETALGGDAIGDTIEAAKARLPDRFRIRWSRPTAQIDGATVINNIPAGPKTVDGAIVCPAQTDATACCATCGLCWEPANASNAIAFVKHGPKSSETQAASEMRAASNDNSIRRVQALASIHVPSEKVASIPPPPSVRLVDPCSLQIEGAYQRDLSKQSIGLIRKIVSGWDWKKYKPPICAARPDGMYVIDGQHTAIAAATLKIKQIPVLIAHAEVIEERAEAFVAHNRDRLNMSPFQIFHASVTAGDQVAVAIASAAERTGAIIPRSMPPRGREKPGQIIGVRDITNCAKVSGIRTVERIFRIAVAAEAAPLGVCATRALRMIFAEPYFAETAKMPDSRIANGLKTIANFEATARLKGDETGQGQVRAGAMMIVEACKLEEAA